MRRTLTALVAILVTGAVPYAYVVSSGLIGADPTLQPSSGAKTAEADETPSWHALAAEAPLYARLYFASGLKEEQAGNAESAEELIQHAANLNPRLLEARLWLAQDQLKSGDMRAAVDQLVALYAISDRAHQPVSRMLALAARDGAARREIANRLANSPHLLGVASQAAAVGLSSSQLSELLAKTDLTKLPKGLETAQLAVSTGALRAKDFQSAYAAWNSVLPAGYRTNYVYDGNFKALPGAKPFTWTLKQDGALNASSVRLPGPGPRTALELGSTSPLPLSAAEQLIVLPAGSFVVEAQVKSPAPKTSNSGFEWVIHCQDGPAIGSLPIAGSDQAWARQRWPLTVPLNCPAQRLELRATAAEPGSEHNLQLSGVAVHKLR